MFLAGFCFFVDFFFADNRGFMLMSSFAVFDKVFPRSGGFEKRGPPRERLALNGPCEIDGTFVLRKEDAIVGSGRVFE